MELSRLPFCCYRSAWSLVLPGLCALGWVHSAAAQQIAASAAGAGNEPLQEVVVTAERRTENLQTTSIAATVLSADDLRQKGVVQLADLQNASPSLSITAAGLTQNVNIRGIGLDSGSPSVVPGVATYRDGLWQPPILSTDTLYDIGSVEVLRGPQGTFVGSNSTGGAVFLNTRNPDFNGVHGNVEVLGGNYSDVGGNGTINLPISDAWAVRAAFDMEERDSFFRDVTSQLTPSAGLFDHPGSQGEKNGRVSLLGKPLEDLEVLLKVEVNDKSTGGYAYKPVPGTEYAPYAESAPFNLNYDHDTLNDELGVRTSLKLDWNINGSGYLLRSLTGDQFMRVHNVYDLDATSSTLPSGPPAQWENQAIIERPLSQEFNLISPDTGRLQWILGAFYLHDIRVVDLSINSQAIPQSITLNDYQIIQTAAAFGQVSFQLAPGWQLQAGLRYTHDWNEVPNGKTVDVLLGIPGVPPSISSVAGIETDSAVTGKVALNWTVNDSNFLYAFVAKGAKSGGFNAAGAGTLQTNFAPEEVWDYELGWKTDLLDKHLRASLGAFWNNYTDLQVASFSPGTGTTSLINAGKSTIKGSELEFHAHAGGLAVDFGGAYVNSRLGALTLINTEALPPNTNLPQCGAGMVPPSCFNYDPYNLSLSGSENPYSPEWTFNAGVQYALPVGSGTLTPRLNYSYVGAQWSTLFELPATDYLRSFGLWNANLTYEKGDWRVQLYGQNLTNKLYVTGQSAAGSNPDNEFLGNPRQYGVRISRSF